MIFLLHIALSPQAFLLFSSVLLNGQLFNLADFMVNLYLISLRLTLVSFVVYKTVSKGKEFPMAVRRAAIVAVVVASKRINTLCHFCMTNNVRHPNSSMKSRASLAFETIHNSLGSIQNISMFAIGILCA